MSQIAALYARVSTLQQEQEATIESQIAALETFAQKHDYVLSPDLYFIDQAVSGYQLERPWSGCVMRRQKGCSRQCSVWILIVWLVSMSISA